MNYSTTTVHTNNSNNISINSSKTENNNHQSDNEKYVVHSDNNNHNNNYNSNIKNNSNNTNNKSSSKLDEQDKLKDITNLYNNHKQLQEICKINGIAKDEFVNGRTQINTIELFMSKFESMMGIEYFPNLTKLILMNQDIQNIENLNTFPHLKVLWLNENKIKKIQGLENMKNLCELYLHGNQISTIECLNGLTKLQVLWLNDNQIKEIEGINELKELRVLWIGGNKIERIEARLDPNQALEELNVAGNKIGRFKEIPYLDRLKNLKSLYLKCPFFGENPVCNLCNYQTYVLYHLNSITSLDSIKITEEARQIADATFLKKKMYYNMRIKTLRRNTSNVIKKAAEHMNSKLNEMNLNLNVLMRMKKELEREIDEIEYLPSKAIDEEYINDEKFFKELKLKYNVVKNHIDQKFNEIDNVENIFEDFKSKINEISHHNISRLLVELETGGNIRLEEGKPGDIWFHSCVDLVKSRFFPHDFQPLGIKGIKVLRVTRIHNRYLRNRFEDQLESIVDTSDSSYKRSLEYLFYGESLDAHKDIFGIIEDGFPPASEYGKLDLDHAVPLSNSVSICEIPSLTKDTLKSRKKPLEGHLIIAKVFIGSFTAESQSVKSPKSAKTSKSSPSSPLRMSREEEKIESSKYPNYDSVYRVKKGDGKQRLWFIFDHNLILPEYLVEYELERDDDNEGVNNKDPHELIVSEMRPQNDSDLMDIRSFASPFEKFIIFCRSINEVDNDVCTMALNMPPILKPRKKLSLISDYSISSISRTENFKEITYLNLYGNGIRKMEGLGELVNLKILVMSFNEIQKIEGLEKLVNLNKLELGFNLIKRVEGLQFLTKLESLELNNNLIYRLEDVNVIRKYLPSLRDLNLKSNALCDVKSYRYIIIRRIPNLTKLDGNLITNKERTFANERLNTINDKLIYNHSFTRKKFGYSLSSSSQKEKLQSSLVRSANFGDSWHGKVIELDLCHMRVRKIQNMDKLVNIKFLSLCDNEITRIEGLQECIKLQDLNMEENRIMKIEGLSSLLSLKKLQLGRNKITRLENLELLVRLQQLSIEDNEVDSLRGLETLCNLMELYAGNNRIKHLKELHNLKDLPKLIIMDLSGNVITREDNYRLYAIFNLRKLKVLDGASIDNQELTRSKEEFSGKLTLELLYERAGHNHFKNITELDLSNCCIKQISNLECCENLKKLNLEHNILTSLNGIQKLSNLSILRLSDNRLEAVTPSKNHSVGKYLDNLIYLEVLMLDNNHISSIAALQLYKLKSLKALSLRNNDIMKLEGLEGLVQLQELFIDKNKIRYIDEKTFIGINNLRELRIEENAIRSIDGIKDLPNLHSLYLGCNRIIDLGELEKMTNLPRLKEVILSFNPVARKSLYRATLIFRIPSILFIDNKEVTLEERERAGVFFAQEYFQHLPTQHYAPEGRMNAVQNIPSSRIPVRINSVNFEYNAKDPATHMKSSMHQQSKISNMRDLDKILSYSARAASSRKLSSRHGKLGTTSGVHSSNSSVENQVQSKSPAPTAHTAVTGAIDQLISLNSKKGTLDPTISSSVNAIVAVGVHQFISPSSSNLITTQNNAQPPSSSSVRKNQNQPTGPSRGFSAKSVQNLRKILGK